jgi:uncharacterized protein
MPARIYFDTRPALQVDGRPVVALARDLLALQIETDLHGLSRLQAVFTATGPDRSGHGAAAMGLNWLDGETLDFGRSLAIELGDAADRVRLFEGRISALELRLEPGRSAELSCDAEDALMALRLRRRLHTWENVSEADLLRRIAADHGLAAAPDIDGPTHDAVPQWNQSDLAFLRERARRLAAEIWIEDRTLHMAAREHRDAGSLTLVQGASLQGVALRADLAHQRSAVRVGGWDASAEAEIDETVAADTLAGEAQGGLHGGTVLARAFGDADTTAQTHRVRDVPLRAEHAQAWARAEMQRRGRRFATARGTANGNPALRVGTRLRLERCTPLFDGDGWHVTRTCHRFDTVDGYRTEFEAERAWLGAAR